VRTGGGGRGYRDVLRDRPFVLFSVSSVVLIRCTLALPVHLAAFLTGALDLPGWATGCLLAVNMALA
jgi:hypothetical protein